MNRKRLIKTGIVLIIVGIISFSDWSFAADDSEGLLQTIGELLYLLVSMLSWIWIFFAKGAGEFLTNKWVYGEAIGLDAILWQYRNIVKNIANFGLGFYFIYEVLKGILDDATKIKIKDKLVRLLVAGVGIQASWFMTAIVIDVSTITLSAVGSFPSVVISNSSELKNSFDNTLGDFFEKGKKLGNEIDKGMRLSLFFPDMGKANYIKLTKDIPLEGTISQKDFYDKVMPRAENVSGPLYYLGLSILKTSVVVSPASTSERGWKATILSTLLQGGTSIIFCIEMFVLLIVAVMRMVYLWGFIVLSPLVLLLKCIEKASSNGGGKGFMEEYTKGFKKHFNFSSFFWNVFKPTLIVLGFSLAMIFVTLISDTIINNKGRDFDMEGFTTYNQKSGGTDETGDGDLKYTTSIDGDAAGIVIRSGGKTLFELILSIITVFLVYIVLKMAVNMGDGTDFMSTKIKNMQDTVTKYMTKLPVMPVSGYDEKGHATTRWLSAGKVFGVSEDGRVDMNNSIIGQKIGHYSGKIEDENTAQNQILKSWFGNTTGDLSSAEIDKIKSAMTTSNPRDGLRNVKTEINKIKDKTGKGMTLNTQTSSNNGFWIGQFEEWLTKMNKKEVTGTSYNIVWKNMINRWNDDKNKDGRTLEKMFKNNASGETDSVKAYANFFGLGSNIDTWEELKDADISKGTSSEAS